MLSDLTDALVHSYWTVVAGLCVGLSLALLVSYQSTATYEATIVIDAVPDTSPDEKISPEVWAEAEERFETIRERVITRRYLSELVSHEMGIADDLPERADVISAILSGVHIDHHPRGREFTIRYRDVDRDRAATVANWIASRFVQESTAVSVGGGDHFAILESSGPAPSSAWPKRGGLLSIGSVVGLVAFVGPLLLTRSLSPIINSEIELRAVTEIPVLARIPPLANAYTQGRIRRRRARNLVLSAVSITMLALTVVLFR